MEKQTITRKGSFDSGHRVMNECMKCFNIHGHTYLYELTFNFSTIKEIGYSIDFKEIKRVGCQWIDDALDHGMILNPKDEQLIQTTKNLNSKLWLMSLNGENEYCNPSAENIAKEIFMAMEVLFQPYYPSLQMQSIRLYETPNCYTDCFSSSMSTFERLHFMKARGDELKVYSKEKGIIEYDDRKIHKP